MIQNLTLTDISVFNGEPTILDLRLAELLGYEKVHKIRDLIKRNLPELERYGTVFSATVAENTDDEDDKRPTAGRTRPTDDGIFPTAGKNTRGRGRPGTEYHLNEGQALLIATLSKTENAAEVRYMLITVFIKWRQQGGLLHGGANLPAAPIVDIDMERAPLAAKVELLRLVERYYGRRGAMDYMPRLGLPIPASPPISTARNGIASEEAMECLAFLLEWQIEGGLVGELALSVINDDDEKAAAALERIGIRATPEGVWIIAAHDNMKAIWQRTKWRGIWRQILCRLPGITFGHERISIGGHQGRPIWLPASILA